MGKFLLCSCPCFHPGMLPFCTGALMSSQFSQASLLMCLLVFLSITMNCFRARKILSLKTCYLSWPPLPLKTASHGIPPKSFLNKTVCSTKFQGLYSATVLPYSLHNPELHDFMVTAAKATADCHIPKKFLLLNIISSCEPSPSWSIWYLYQEAIPDALWNSSLHFAVLPFQQLEGSLNSPVRARVCDTETFSSYLKEHLLASWLWSGDLEQFPTTMSLLTDLSSSSRLPQALNQPFVCCIQELHTFKLVLNIKGNLSSTYSLPPLLEEPVSIHHSTQVMQVVPPHLSYCSIDNLTIQHLHIEH